MIMYLAGFLTPIVIAVIWYRAGLWLGRKMHE